MKKITRSCKHLVKYPPLFTLYPGKVNNCQSLSWENIYKGEAPTHLVLKRVVAKIIEDEDFEPSFFAFVMFLLYRGVSKEMFQPSSHIHLIPKWWSINYSFVCMSISPLCLIFTSKLFCVLYTLTRHQGLINMKTKE